MRSASDAEMVGVGTAEAEATIIAAMRARETAADGADGTAVGAIAAAVSSHKKLGISLPRKENLTLILVRNSLAEGRRFSDWIGSCFVMLPILIGISPIS